MIYSSALNECICDNTDGTTGYFMVDGVCLKHCSRGTYKNKTYGTCDTTLFGCEIMTDGTSKCGTCLPTLFKKNSSDLCMCNDGTYYF